MKGFLKELDLIHIEEIYVTGKSLCYEPEGPLRPALISGFRSMKRLGVFMLPPGWDASPSQGTPSITPVPIYTPGWREAP